MKKNLKIEGFHAKIYKDGRSSGYRELYRTSQYSTAQEALEALIESVFLIGDDIRLIEHSKGYAASVKDCTCEEDIETLYEEGDFGVVEFIDTLKQWIRSGFELSTGDDHCGPYNSCLDGTGSACKAYISWEQAKEISEIVAEAQQEH